MRDRRPAGCRRSQGGAAGVGEMGRMGMGASRFDREVGGALGGNKAAAQLRIGRAADYSPARPSACFNCPYRSIIGESNWQPAEISSSNTL